jgi:PAS domain-containing protein/SAM-dependent methyltransferase
MPQSEPITFLIVNAHAEEIKLVTISLRGFFADVRVEVAYSAEEAERMAEAPPAAMSVVLIDEGSLPDAPSQFIADLKRRAPYASIILQTSRADSAAAVEALDLGADLFLYKHSPAFLGELLFCAKEALKKRDSRLAGERAQAHRSWLMETGTDLLYELDADGRFLAFSHRLSAMLGYRPEELVGRPYSTLFSQAEQRLARFRFNERRAGGRAVKDFRLTLEGKSAGEGPLLVAAWISARGLYDVSRRFIGTIGLIKKPSKEATEQELGQQRQRVAQLEGTLRQMSELSHGLEQPVFTLLHEAQRLSEALREARLLDRLQTFTGQAAAAADMVQRLASLTRPAAADHIIHRLLKNVLHTEGSDAAPASFAPDFTAALPEYCGNPGATARFFTQLLTYAGAYLSTVGRSQVLALKTSAAGHADAADPSLFPLTPSPSIQLEITETDTVDPSTQALARLPEALDTLSLYRLAQDLGATLDLSAPPRGPFRMIVRLPGGAGPALRPNDGTSSTALPSDAAVEPPDTSPSAVSSLTPDGHVERRRNARIETSLPAKITRGSTTWEGTVVTLNVDGAGIRVSDDFPSMAEDDAVISVTTSIATLQLAGSLHTRSATADSGLSDARLIVRFREPDQTETAVFASLISAAHERSLTFTLDIRIPVASRAQEPAARGSFDLAEHDRRETVRVPSALPARLATEFRQEPGARVAAQVMNLSRSGACMLVQEQPENLQGSIQIHFAPAHRSERGSHEPGAPDTVLGARVVWAAADPSAPRALHASNMTAAGRVGLRFEVLTPYAERELNRVIRQHLRAQRSGAAFAAAAPVVSVPRECRNARGQAIGIMDDHLSQLTDPNRPIVIIAPGYGQTASDYTALSYYLATHHVRILRYDATNHLGNSEGELQQTTLRGLQHDLEQVIEFVRHTWPQAPVVVMASDLSARAALKAAARTRPLDLLLLINPAIDPASTLLTVHGHDLIADYQFGLRRGVCNLLGLNVNVDQFVGDLVAGRCADLESTLEDLRVIRSPLCIATCPPDSTGLPPTDLPHTFMTALGTHTRLVNISSPLTDRHLDVEDPPSASFKQLLKQIDSVLSMQPVPVSEEGAVQPYVARQQRLEQEYTFLRHDGSQINREALCAGHLAHLPHLGNLHEYRKLLDDLYGLMSPLEPGAVLVDTGVGQSDLTRAALINHTYRAGQSSWTGRPSPLLVGVGRSRERINQGRHAVLVLQRELATGFVGRLSAMPPLSIGWLQADWMHALPFRTGSVSRLVCNLSLPYVPSPLAALREWHRVLHPDGCLIFTTFHPNTDLSPLYRRHLRQANQDEFSAQAQPLLHYFARLREAIRHRILHTFDEPGLAALLGQCRIASFRILPIFDGQALVAIVGKQNSSSSLH